MEAEQDKLLATIGRNAVEQIRISHRIYKGFVFVDVRQYWLSDDGEWRPSKRGITLPLAIFEEFCDAIAKAKVQIADEIEAAHRSRERRARA